MDGMLSLLSSDDIHRLDCFSLSLSPSLCVSLFISPHRVQGIACCKVSKRWVFPCALLASHTHTHTQTHTGELESDTEQTS